MSTDSTVSLPFSPLSVEELSTRFYTACKAHTDARDRVHWLGAQIADTLVDDGHVDAWYLNNYRQVRDAASAAAAEYEPYAARIRLNGAAARAGS